MEKTVHISIDNLEDPIESLEGDIRLNTLAAIHQATPVLRKMLNYRMLKNTQDGHNNSKSLDDLAFSQGAVLETSRLLLEIEAMFGEYEDHLHPEKILDPQNPLPEL